MEKCILIIDDDEDTLQLTSIILERSDYKVITIDRCGEDIVDKVKEIRPQIILMDLRIPEIGGAKGTRLIKNDPAINKIPLILFSADKDIEMIADDVNADGALRKPFDINTLRLVIKNNIS